MTKLQEKLPDRPSRVVLFRFRRSSLGVPAPSPGAALDRRRRRGGYRHFKGVSPQSVGESAGNRYGRIRDLLRVRDLVRLAEKASAADSRRVRAREGHVVFVAG